MTKGMKIGFGVAFTLVIGVLVFLIVKAIKDKNETEENSIPEPVKAKVNAQVMESIKTRLATQRKLRRKLPSTRVTTT